MVADFAEHFNGIAVSEGVLVSGRGVESGREKETGIDSEFSLCLSTECHDGAY